MPKEISRMKKGAAPSLVEADVANLLIDAVNAIRRLRIVPQGYGTIQFSDNEGIIDLSGLQSLIQQLSTTGTQSGNGANTQDQPTNGTNVSGGNSSDLLSRIIALESRLSAPQLSIVCNADGTITGTVTI